MLIITPSSSGVPQDQTSELHGCVFTEMCSRCHALYQRDYYVMDDVASQYWEDIQEVGHTELVRPEHAVQCELCELTHYTGRKCNKKVILKRPSR